MKRFLYSLVLVGLIALVGVFVYAWYFGGYRVARDTNAFADAIEACAEFDQNAYVPLNGMMLSRKVDSDTDSSCEVRMQVFGSQFMLCILTPQERAVFAAGLRAQLAGVGFLGRPKSIQFTIPADDPYTELLNSPACSVETSSRALVRFLWGG